MSTTDLSADSLLALTPEDIDALEGDFAEAPDVSRIPDGAYHTKLTGFDFCRTPETKKPAIRTQHTVVESVDGKFVNAQLTQYHTIEPKRNMEFVKPMLREPGYVDSDGNTLPLKAIMATASRVVGKRLAVSVRTNDRDFQNVFINSVVTEEQSEEK